MDPSLGGEFDWFLPGTLVALAFCHRYCYYTTVNVGHVKLSFGVTDWFWRFYFTDLNFMECCKHVSTVILRDTFEVVRDEEVSFSSLSRCRNSSWGNGTWTPGTVASLRTMCFSGSISPHWMWFQSLKRRCIFCYNKVPKCKPTISSGVQLIQQQFCPTLGENLAALDLVRDGVWYVRLYHHALLRRFSGSTNYTKLLPSDNT